MDSNTVYINNLSFKKDEEGVRRLCSKYGNVIQVKIVIDFETQESKGMAFVEMSSAQEALKVIKGLNGAKIDGRTLKAKEATPQGSRAREKTRVVLKGIKKVEDKKVQEAKPKKTPRPRQEKKTGLDKLFDFLKEKKTQKR